MISRRLFIKNTVMSSGVLITSPYPGWKSMMKKPKIKISLAQWSLHRALDKGIITNLDFAGLARNKFGIEAVEYVNTFFKTTLLDYKQAGVNKTYLHEVLKRSKDAGIYNHLIMVDEEGPLALPDDKVRLQAVDNHKKWIDAAKYLGCATVRVNLHGDGTSADKQKAAIDSLGRLGEYAAPSGINVVIENHGSDSSNGKWVAAVMKGVNKSNIGTLPDFGNFCISHPWGETQGPCTNEYDRYLGISEMLPFAKGVSAKTYDFDVNGEQPKMDYSRLIDIVKKSGFNGYIGIEYEGYIGGEDDGIRLTKKLLDKYL